MKKFLASILAFIMVLSLVACGSKPTDAAPQTTEQEENNDAIEVDENLLTVELTIPPDFAGEEVTQEELDAEAKEHGYKSATLNADGSVTYVMTKAQHKKLMAELKTTIDEGLAELVGAEDTPTIAEIKANDSYTEFEVILSSDTVGFMEGLTTLACYMYGGFYNAFNGTDYDNISVDYINQATGEVIETANSSDLAE